MSCGFTCLYLSLHWGKDITIYAPMIYTAPCTMFWMRAYPLRGEVGGGWALDFPSFLGPVKWERADRRVPFGAQKTWEFQGPLRGEIWYQNVVCPHTKNSFQKNVHKSSDTFYSKINFL
jgi:hypothetical protein